MKIKKIVMSLLSLLFLCSFSYKARAEYAPDIRSRCKELITVHGVYSFFGWENFVRNRISFVSGILDYFCENRASFSSKTSGELRGIIEIYFEGSESSEIVRYDKASIVCAKNYTEYIYNLTMVYLTYVDISDQNKVQQRLVEYDRLLDSVELFWHGDEVQPEKDRRIEESFRPDDFKRVSDEIERRMRSFGMGVFPGGLFIGSSPTVVPVLPSLSPHDPNSDVSDSKKVVDSELSPSPSSSPMVSQCSALGKESKKKSKKSGKRPSLSSPALQAVIPDTSYSAKRPRAKNPFSTSLPPVSHEENTGVGAFSSASVPTQPTFPMPNSSGSDSRFAVDDEEYNLALGASELVYLFNLIRKFDSPSRVPTGGWNSPVNQSDATTSDTTTTHSQSTSSLTPLKFDYQEPKPFVRPVSHLTSELEKGSNK